MSTSGKSVVMNKEKIDRGIEDSVIQLNCNRSRQELIEFLLPSRRFEIVLIAKRE